MSQTVDVNMKPPLRWPIAPDGYIPNSVIRWQMGGRGFNQMPYWDDIFLSGLPRGDESMDMSSITYWFEEEGEGQGQEVVDFVQMRKMELLEKIEKEKRIKEKEEKDRKELELEVKKRLDEYNDQVKAEKNRNIHMEQPNSIQKKTKKQQQLKTSDDDSYGIEFNSTHSSRRTSADNFKSHRATAHSDETSDETRYETSYGPKQLNLSGPVTQTSTSFIPTGLQVAPEESSVESSDTDVDPLIHSSRYSMPKPDHLPFNFSSSGIFPYSEPTIASSTPPSDPKILTSHPLMSSSIQLPTLDDPQAQADQEFTDGRPNNDKRFLIASNENNCTGDPEQVPLDQKAMNPYNKVRLGNNDPSQLRTPSTTAQQPLSVNENEMNESVTTTPGSMYGSPAAGASQSMAQTYSCVDSLNGSLGSASENMATQHGLRLGSASEHMATQDGRYSSPASSQSMALANSEGAILYSSLGIPPESTAAQSGPYSPLKSSTSVGSSTSVVSSTSVGCSTSVGSTPASVSKQSPGDVRPKGPRPFTPADAADVARTFLSIKNIKNYETMPEWRKKLYQLIRIRGFASPKAASFAAEHWERLANDQHDAANIPSLQPCHIASHHQRVVQKIQWKASPEPGLSDFHHVIPMFSQQSFFPSNPRGKTQYGRLQFDWMRGCEEDKLLKVVDERRVLYDLNRSS